MMLRMDLSLHCSLIPIHPPVGIPTYHMEPGLSSPESKTKEIVNLIPVQEEPDGGSSSSSSEEDSLDESRSENEADKGVDEGTSRGPVEEAVGEEDNDEPRVMRKFTRRFQSLQI